MAIVTLLNVLGQVGSHVLDNLSADALLFFLRGNQLLIEGILFLSDGVDAVEVVHVADGAWTAPGHLEVEFALPHDGRLLRVHQMSVGRGILLSRVKPAMITRAVNINMRRFMIAVAVGAAPASTSVRLRRRWIVLEVRRSNRLFLMLIIAPR